MLKDASFACKDERKNQFFQKQIDKNMPLEHYYRTMMPITKICEELEKDFRVEISNDPGRFLCNYIYYLSLQYGYKNNIPSIFVHVSLYFKFVV